MRGGSPNLCSVTLGTMQGIIIYFVLPPFHDYFLLYLAIWLVRHNMKINGMIRTEHLITMKYDWSPHQTCDWSIFDVQCYDRY